MKVYLTLGFGGDTKAVFYQIIELPLGLSPVAGLKFQDSAQNTLNVEQVDCKLDWETIKPPLQAPVALKCRYTNMKLADFNPKSLEKLGWKRI
jgi:hypothetical protein